MKPAKFEYHRPDNLPDALRLLEEAGFDGKVIAGGQSLVPIMNMRLATPECLIDINGLTDLDFIKYEGNVVKIGAMTRQSQIEASETINQKLPLLKEAVRFIGHVQTRNRGTVGGSIVHADPSAELPLVLMTLGGSVKISSGEEERSVDAEDFFLTYLTTDLMPTEILTEVHIPVWQGKTGHAFLEIARRHGDFALVAASCQIAIDRDGSIEKVRLALGGVEAIPFLIEDAQSLLGGKQLTDALIDQVAKVVEESVEPEGDLHASEEYRRHLAKVLTSRALWEAYEKAKGG
ncbi:xanthine dehydrogenase family protein subunit M [Bacillus sp. N1-1]|uniref:FAD binding domain-containing protein n=1 Tax=Bacillus sp. N1-1 TaxID=2682541 RepID=UPI0013162B3C|nr:xanthine dehydrogenase family protein subunit M [Bacillus sp. N1-1]QHA93090.1 xanthine dehydrogenase family protein subunit M [Bacillus sp. N1-1]